MVLKETDQPIEIDFTLVETGLNTYSNLEIDMPVNLQSGLVFDIDKIEYDFEPPFDPAAAGRVQHAAQLTFVQQTAILNWEDNDVIAAWREEAHASAALLHSGVRIYELHTETKGRANLIARQSIFLGVDSLNTTLVTRTSGRIIGSLVKIKQDQLTQLVLNQLT